MKLRILRFVPSATRVRSNVYVIVDLRVSAFSQSVSRAVQILVFIVLIVSDRTEVFHLSRRLFALDDLSYDGVC